MANLAKNNPTKLFISVILNPGRKPANRYACQFSLAVIHATKRRLLPPNRLPGLDLPSLEHLVALDESLEKLQIDDTSEAFTMTARYSYIDMLGHMNNARYVEAITNAVPFDLMTKRELDWIQVNYDKEVRPQERLSIRVAELSEDLYGVEGFNLDSEQQAFTAQLKFCRNKYTFSAKDRFKTRQTK